ncbi:MAG: DUF1292 domain-containing protein [Gemmiger sp.]|nr:DUF1292 domain-containing protein [Gemmiger sp.]
MAENLTPDVDLEEGPDILTLEDEDGKECSFEVLDATDVDDVHYLAVVPCVEEAEEEPEEAELIIMRVGKDDEGEYMDIVDDDEELYRISSVFEERLRAQFDIDDTELKS